MIIEMLITEKKLKPYSILLEKKCVYLFNNNNN
jgi:hypothetical protein